MVMDFGFLKQVMIQEIYNPCDHGLILYQHDEVVKVLQGEEFAVPKWLKLLQLPTVPTAENLAKYWYTQVRGGITEWGLINEVDLSLVQLETMRVWETPNCLATYSPPQSVDRFYPVEHKTSIVEKGQ